MLSLSGHHTQSKIFITKSSSKSIPQLMVQDYEVSYLELIKQRPVVMAKFYKVTDQTILKLPVVIS